MVASPDGHLKADVNAMIASANMFTGYAEKYASTYTHLYSLIDSLAGTNMWTGKDNQAYVQRIREYMNDFQYMQQLILRYAEHLQKSAMAYRSAQDVISARTKKLTDNI